MYLAGKAVAADSDSEDEDEDSSSNDGSPARSRPLAAPASIGGPLSGGLTIPATMNDPGQLLQLPAPANIFPLGLHGHRQRNVQTVPVLS